MNYWFKTYVVPMHPVVKESGLSIDTLLYVALCTILNPLVVTLSWLICNIFLKLQVPYLFLCCILINACWVIRALNIWMRRCPSSFHDPTHCTVLITGGSSGLGLDLIQKLCQEDHVQTIIVIDMTLSNKLKQLQQDHSQIEFYSCDLGDVHATNFTFDRILNSYKDIDVLICNAGLRQHQTFIRMSETECSRVLRVGFGSHARLIHRLVANHNIYRPDSKLHIVAISSVLGFIAPSTLGVYSAAKASIIELFDSLSHELPSSFALSVIVPGQLDTDMFNDVNVKNEFLAPVIDHHILAERIVSIIQDGYNGLFIYPLYGRFIPLLRCLPYWLYEALRRFSDMDQVTQKH